MIIILLSTHLWSVHFASIFLSNIPYSLFEFRIVCYSILQIHTIFFSLGWVDQSRDQFICMKFISIYFITVKWSDRSNQIERLIAICIAQQWCKSSTKEPSLSFIVVSEMSHMWKKRKEKRIFEKLMTAQKRRILSPIISNVRTKTLLSSSKFKYQYCTELTLLFLIHRYFMAFVLIHFLFEKILLRFTPLMSIHSGLVMIIHKMCVPNKSPSYPCISM